MYNVIERLTRVKLHRLEATFHVAGPANVREGPF